MEFLQWQVGDVRITCVPELAGGTLPGTFLFDKATPDYVLRHTWLQPHFATQDGLLRSAVQAFVVQSGPRRIVVDTCIGNDKTRTIPVFNDLQTPFLDRMAEAGFPVESIDTVLCTHLHVDHVGWNTKLVNGRWEPTFPNARYLFGRVEWEHWSGDAANHYDGDVIGDSVRPIVDRSLCDFVEMDHRITNEVCLVPTPGHTPGHVSVDIRSAGHRAVITGDSMHHPIQCCEPDLSCRFDVTPARAASTRREFLAAHAGTPVLVIGTHFAAPTGGWVETDGEVWRFRVASDGESA